MFKFTRGSGWNETTFVVKGKDVFDACKKLSNVMVSDDSYDLTHGPILYELSVTTLNEDQQKEYGIKSSNFVQFHQAYQTPGDTYWSTNYVGGQFKIIEIEDQDVITIKST